MKKLIILVLLSLGLAGFFWLLGAGGGDRAAAGASGGPTRTNTPMVEAAQALLAGLDEAQRQQAVLPFSSDERKNFHFTPQVRQGIPWESLDAGQREKAATLLQTTLSEQGYRKTQDIMALENVLRRLENRPPDDRYRHPELYYLAIFGEPSDDAPWGWRFEGHHVSFNFSAVTRELAVTPAFLGSNPADVPSGPEKGKRVLREEEDLARELMARLSDAQRRKAIIATRAPREIITGADRAVSLQRFEGLSYHEMTPAQQQMLQQLIRVYLDNMKPRIAQNQWQRIENACLDSLFFAWAGSLEPGQGHYYRIHGPSFLVEYDNTQNNANHIHTVWRDPTNDFGEDLLRKHYEENDHH